jgi:T5SS/PEP-CTERM-associated repeat protein
MFSDICPVCRLPRFTISILFFLQTTLIPALVVSLAAGALNAQSNDLNFTSPTILTGDQASIGSRILTVSSVPADNASLSLVSGAVNGSGARASASTLVVGGSDGGKGILSITGGSAFEVQGNNSPYSSNINVSGLNLRTGSSVLGISANSFGTIHVSGPGSTWTSNTATIGRAGYGQLILENGATATVQSSQNVLTSMGSLAGSLGVAQLTGNGTTWNTSTLFVGNRGEGRISVSDGAVLRNTNSPSFANVQIGNEAGSLGVVDVFNGGVVQSRDVFIGTFAGSEGRVTVSGAGSRWDATNESFAVGFSAKGSLLISAGGGISSEAGGVGLYAGSDGNATVTGTGSSWNTVDDFTVGGFSSGTGMGSLTISDQGLVSVGDELRNWGRILVETGGVLEAKAILNYGEITIKDGGGGGGEWRENTESLVKVSGTLTNYAGSILNVLNGSTLEVNTVENSGTLIIEQGAAVRNVANFILNGGTAEINGMLETANLTLNSGVLQGSGGLSLDKLVINSGAAVSGNLTVDADLEVAAGGKLAPGNSPGTVTVNGNLVLNGEYDWEVDGANADLTIVNGNINWNGTLNVLPLNGGSYLGATYSLFAYTGSFTGNFSPVAGYQITLDASVGGANVSGLNGYKFANITAVPEPGTLLPLGLVAFGLLTRNRRRAEVAAQALK